MSQDKNSQDKNSPDKNNTEKNGSDKNRPVIDDTSKAPSAAAAVGAKPSLPQSADAARKPYATLDLKATEIAAGKSEPAKSEASKPSAPKADAAKPEPSKLDPAKAEPAKSGAAPASPKTAATTAGTTAGPTASTGAAPGASTETKSGTMPPNPTASATTPKGAPETRAPLSHIKAPAPSAAQWLTSLISGVAGAVIALLGLGSMGLIGGDPNSGTMADRLSVLEKSITAGRPGADLTKQLAAADARIAAVEATAHDLAEKNTTLAAEAKSLSERLAQQPSTPAPVANDRVEKLEQQLTELSNAANNDPQKGRIPALAQITTRLGDLDTQITTRASTLKSELSQEMEKRFAAAADSAETARSRLAQRTQSLEQTVKSVSDETNALWQAVDGLKADFDSRIKATAKPADVAAAIEPMTSKVDGLVKDLATVVRSEQDRNATAGNVVLALELNNLKRAIDRGGNYAPELAAVRKAGGGKLNLSVLESEQSSGLPSLATLTKEFNAVAYKMLDADVEPSRGSVLDRMLASAKSMVKVRKVVHSPDDTGTEATIGRMEVALKDGRLGDLLDELKKLGDKPRAAAAPWLKQVEARYTIETALAKLDDSLKNALATSTAPQKGAN